MAHGAHMHASIAPLAVRLVDRRQVIAGLVSTVVHPNRITIMISEDARVHPEVVRELERQGGQVIPCLARLVEPGRPYSIRYFLEHDIPGGQMVFIDPDIGQTDVYIRHGLMPLAAADELAAHSTLVLPDVLDLASHLS